MKPGVPIKLLLVEDNPQDAAMIIRLVGQAYDKMCEVTHVTRLSQALEKIADQKKPFDVVLLDFGLPDSAGLSTFTRFLEQAPDLPILVLTAIEDDANVTEAIKLGAQDYLLKSEIHTSLLRRSICYSIDRHEIRTQLTDQTINLAASEQRFRSLIENASDAFFLHDEFGRFLDVNDQACKMLGYSKAELLTMQVADNEVNYSEEKIKAILADIVPGVPITLYSDLKRKDGGVFPVEVRVNIFSINNKRMVLALVRDITERKAHENRIKRLTQLYAALNMCNDAILRCTSKEEIFDQVCKSTVQFGGMKMAAVCVVEETTGRIIPVASCGDETGYLDGIPLSVNPDDPYGNGSAGRCIREMKPQWCDDFLTNPKLTQWRERAENAGWKALACLPIYCNCVPVGLLALYAQFADAFDPEARELMCKIADGISLALDIFRRREELSSIQESLRKSEELYRTLFESSNDGIFLLNLNEDPGRILAVNTAAVQMHGLARDEILGRKIHEFCAPESAALASGRISQIKEKHNLQFEVEHVHKDGSVFQLEVNASLVELSNREFLLAITRNITQRRISDQKLQESREQLRALSQSLQEVREVERTRISRDIHDQLGQMLTAMNMDVRWLEKKLDQPVNPKMRSEIKARLTEVAALSDQCIETVQRIATELRPSVLDNLGLAEAIRDEARRYSIRTGISCLTDLPDHLVTSSNQGDTAFFRIFQELLTNVARHSKAKSVNVSLNDKDGWRVMVVSDDGVGMSAGVLNSRKSVGITGMKERASALAGSVEFFVGDGCGTRVEVKIPNGDCIESQSIRKGENRLL